MTIPFFVRKLIKDLEDHSFEAYIVGGSVRDFLLGKSVRGKGVIEDWDLTTNATPEEMLKIWPDAKYENKFGTVTVKTKSKKNNRGRRPSMKKIKVERTEFDFMRSNTAFLEKLKSIKWTELNSHYYCTVAEDQADDLRDICGEQLQIVGFDKEYNLTNEGRILESLIDKFFVG